MSWANNSRGDVGHWRLTPTQAARYHSRLARMHANASARLADRAIRYARIAQRLGMVGAGLALLSILSIAIQAVLR